MSSEGARPVIFATVSCVCCDAGQVAFRSTGEGGSSLALTEGMVFMALTQGWRCRFLNGWRFLCGPIGFQDVERN
jgi:hypothetical protein